MRDFYPKHVGLPPVICPRQQDRNLQGRIHPPGAAQGPGYATGYVGKWHLGDQPEFPPTVHGFDSYVGIPYSNDMGPAADGARSNLGESPPPAKGFGHPPCRSSGAVRLSNTSG